MKINRLRNSFYLFFTLQQLFLFFNCFLWFFFLIYFSLLTVILIFKFYSLTHFVVFSSSRSLVVGNYTNCFVIIIFVFKKSFAKNTVDFFLKKNLAVFFCCSHFKISLTLWQVHTKFTWFSLTSFKHFFCKLSTFKSFRKLFKKFKYEFREVSTNVSEKLPRNVARTFKKFPKSRKTSAN